MGAQDNRARRVGICVDDFGMSEGVDASVLALASAGRISATSVLVDGPSWPANAGRLIQGAGQAIDIGLHLNLSEPFPGGPPRPSWGPLVTRAYARMLDIVELRAEVSRQLDAFERHAGRPPDFVDGHRHVHTLPGVREALVESLVERYPRRRQLWLRRTAPGGGARTAGDRFKGFVIHALGGGALDRLVRVAGLKQNRYLLGVYGFTGSAEEHERRLAAWLAAAHDGDLLMCHTGLPGGRASGDAIGAAREVEHRVLMSETFGRLLAESRVQVTKLSLAL